MRVKRTHAVLAGTVLAAFGSGVLSPTQASVPVAEVGWWTRAPIPPDVPEGGLAVGAAPDGDVTVGAIKLDVGAGASGASLRLTEQQARGVAALQVCTAASTWSDAQGKPLPEAPADGCDSNSVELKRSEDGTWSADIQGLVGSSSGLVSVIVKPASGALLPAFDVVFARPTVEGTVSTAGSGSGSGGGGGSAPSTGGSDAPFDGFEPAPSFQDDVPSYAPPTGDSTGGPTTTAAPATTTATSEPDFDAALGNQPVGLSPTSSSRGDVSRGQVLVWALMSILVGAFAAAVSWARTEGKLTPAVLLSGRTRSVRDPDTSSELPPA